MLEKWEKDETGWLLKCWDLQVSDLDLGRILVESNTGSEMEDVRAVANRDHQAGTGVELSFKQGPPHEMRLIFK